MRQETASLPLAIEYDYDGWLAFFQEAEQPAYRAGQICSWIWQRGVCDPADMTDFSKPLRVLLAEKIDFFLPQIVKEERAKDGTRKFLIQMQDGVKIETALLKQGDRLTACLSTQAGCAIGCPFCLTGSGGFERNLSRGEIAAQFITMEKHIGREINNLVFMGMGEPFLNCDALLGAIRVLNAPRMRGLGIRHMTVSTAGIVSGIEALAVSGLGVRLAVSLHAVDDELRDELVPCNTTYPLEELFAALHRYQETTGDRITVEYALFRERNDSLAHARALVRRLKGLHVYVNLIPGNEGRPGYRKSRPEDVLRFQSVLKSAGFESEIRTERGSDIRAACGQLKTDGEDSPERSAARNVDGEDEKHKAKSKAGGNGQDRGRRPSQRHRSGDVGAGGKGDLSGNGRTSVRAAGRGGAQRKRPASGLSADGSGASDLPRSGGDGRRRPRNAGLGKRRNDRD